jgi:DNA-binding transcriptional ArsR family regulator
MHLVGTQRPGRRVIDADHRVCDAIEAVGDRAAVHAWADLFGALSDPSRLSLLLCIHRAGPICVSDLAVAAGMNDTTVSQALRLLRAHGLVAARRDGRLVRYELTSDTVRELLQRIHQGPAGPPPPAHHHA